MILAGDIGGSKTWLALFSSHNGQLEMIRQQQFVSPGHDSLQAVIDIFLHDNEDGKLSSACFGVPGAVINGQCRTTNLPWTVSAAQLQQHLSLAQVSLINDLAAMAFGMLHLPDEDFIELNPDASQQTGNRAVIAAGTGLGEALLVWDGKHYLPVATEGGHSDFAPQTDQQDALLRWLRKRYPEHVSYERILCGDGTGHLYDFLRDNEFGAAAASIENLPTDADRGAAISACALQQENALCVEALRLFIEIYAAEAGNLALKSLALGGIYIGGGIAPKILRAINPAQFTDQFTSKGRFSEMLRGIPVKLSTNTQAGLIGAAWFAQQDNLITG